MQSKEYDVTYPIFVELAVREALKCLSNMWGKRNEISLGKLSKGITDAFYGPTCSGWISTRMKAATYRR